MPRTPSPNSSSPVVKDVPRAGFTCLSYLDGHNVHYIPVLRLAGDRPWLDAVLTCEHDSLVLAVGAERMVVRHHNETAVRLMLEELGTSCRWYPSLRYACWPGEAVRHWVSLALTELRPCASIERARLADEALWT